MSLSWILTLVAGGLMALSVMLVPIRLGAPRRPGAGWWVLMVVTLAVSGMALVNGMSALAKSETATVLAGLKPVTAAQLQADATLLETPVVIHDVAYCAPDAGQAVDTGEVKALAERVKYSGEDEVEGEDNDYVQDQDYGTEQDVSAFALGAADSPLRVNTDALTVVPAGPSERRNLSTGEYSAVVGRNLNEYEDHQRIPCGATVSVTGVVFKEGEFLRLDPLPLPVSILTDRPWESVVTRAQSQAAGQRGAHMVWMFLAGALALAQLVLTVATRGKG